MGRTSLRFERSRNNGQIDESSVIERQNDRIILLSGEIDERSISAVTLQLFSYVACDASKPIYLVVSTYGGVADEMFGLYDVMQLLPCPIYTIGIAKIMSAGVLLLASGCKGHRQISEHARIMMHSIRGGVAGNVFEIANDTEEMKRQQRMLVDLLVKQTKMKREQIEKLMKSGCDCYITPIEAVTLGIVDEVIKSKDW